jgi:hypothetical protein
MLHEPQLKPDALKLLKPDTRHPTMVARRWAFARHGSSWTSPKNKTKNKKKNIRGRPATA